MNFGASEPVTALPPFALLIKTPTYRVIPVPLLAVAVTSVADPDDVGTVVTVPAEPPSRAADWLAEEVDES